MHSKNEEKSVLCSWKLKSKHMVFNIPYKEKNGEVKNFSVSFLKDYNHEKIIKEMKEISKHEEFSTWIVP